MRWEEEGLVVMVWLGAGECRRVRGGDGDMERSEWEGCRVERGV